MKNSLAYLTSSMIHLFLFVLLGIFAFPNPSRRPTLLSARVQQEVVVDTTAVQAEAEDPEFTAPLESIDLEPSTEKINEPTELDVAMGDSELPGPELAGSARSIESADLAKSIGTRKFATAMPVESGSRSPASAVKAVESQLSPYLRRLRKLPPGQIVVVRGAHDEMERVLSSYRLPHIVLPKIPDQLRCRMLCLNCGVPTSNRSAIREFVAGGGWLITSDWSLELLADCFPKYLERVKVNNPDTVVGVEPSAYSHKLLNGVFDPNKETTWWLESGSYVARVKSKRVHTLVESKQMGTTLGSKDVAFTFEHGKGRVLHLVGHFFQKSGNQNGLVAMHRMILNFVMLHENMVPPDDGMIREWDRIDQETARREAVRKSRAKNRLAKARVYIQRGLLAAAKKELQRLIEESPRSKLLPEARRMLEDIDTAD